MTPPLVITIVIPSRADSVCILVEVSLVSIILGIRTFFPSPNISPFVPSPKTTVDNNCWENGLYIVTVTFEAFPVAAWFIVRSVPFTIVSTTELLGIFVPVIVAPTKIPAVFDTEIVLDVFVVVELVSVSIVSCVVLGFCIKNFPLCPVPTASNPSINFGSEPP